jgi:hypothetical protein
MRLLFILTGVICFLSSCEKTITEFQSQNFIKFFGSGTESKGYDVIIADPAESSYLFVGYDKVGLRNRILAVKTDKNGNTIWENAYQNDSIQEGSIVEKVSDGFLIAGRSQANSGDDINPKIMKINQYGDSVWSKTIIHNYNLVIYDILITGSQIILAGESYESDPTIPECYYACIGTDGAFKWEYSFPGIETFKKVFLNNNGKLLLIGNSSLSGDVINIFEANLTGGTPISMIEKYSANDIIVRDAIYNDDGSLYLLVNDAGANQLKILKYKNYTLEWESKDPPSDLTGKSFTMQEDGSLFITGDYNGEINFVKVDSNGDSYYGTSDYKTIPGNSGKILTTPDNGFILVGNTVSSVGTMVQLIKTDKDLYLLKP